MSDNHSLLQGTYKNTAVVGSTQGFDYVPVFSALGTKLGEITPGPGHKEINEKLAQNAVAHGAVLQNETGKSLAAEATAALVSRAKKKAKKGEQATQPSYKTVTFTTSAGKKITEQVEGMSDTGAGLMLVYPTSSGYIPNILEKLTVTYEGTSHNCQFHGLFFIWIDNTRSVLVLFKLD